MINLDPNDDTVQVHADLIGEHEVNLKSIKIHNDRSEPTQSNVDGWLAGEGRQENPQLSESQLARPCKCKQSNHDEHCWKNITIAVAKSLVISFTTTL